MSGDQTKETDDTARGIETAVRLATHAFDGLDMPDTDLDDLCDAVLSEKVWRMRDKKRYGPFSDQVVASFAATPR